MKSCAKCGASKPLDGFHRQPTGPQGRHSYCKPCANDLQRGVRKRKDSPERRRRNSLWTRYRLRSDEFDALLVSQGGLCAICQTPPERPVVDHCHRTGKVRGILCHSCNIKLPAIENAGFASAASEYLRSKG